MNVPGVHVARLERPGLGRRQRMSISEMEIPAEATAIIGPSALLGESTCAAVLIACMERCNTHGRPRMPLEDLDVSSKGARRLDTPRRRHGVPEKVESHFPPVDLRQRGRGAEAEWISQSARTGFGG